MPSVKEKDAFPAFCLLNDEGNPVTLESLRGSQVVIYFYPKDDTSGCTTEACEFTGLLPKFQSGSGVQVLGVSPDSVASHQKFKKKYSLNFALLADIDHQLAESVGVWVEKSMYGKKYMGIERTTFLLDGLGKIVKIWSKVKPAGHAAEVLDATKQ